MPLPAAGAIAAVALFAAVSVPAQAAAAVTLPAAAPPIIVQRYVSALGGASSPGRDGYTITLPARPSVTAPGVTPAVGTRASAPGAAGMVNTGTGDIRWPVTGPIRISSPFGPRPAPCAICSSVHEGIDIIPGYGTPIGAVAAGRVRVSGVGGEYGQYVIIDHIIDGRTISTLYAHMIYGSSPLRAGEHVAVGQLVGLVGSTGASTGAHLHLQVMLDGVTPVDPLAWLRANAGRTL